MSVLYFSQDPLLPDDPINEETAPSNSTTGLEAFILSCDQHQDSKSNISIHIDALSFKSPVKSLSSRVSSKVRKIKLKKKQQQVKEIDCKQAVQDEIEVKNLLNDLLDRVEKEESQPKNLVFSTLGTSHEATGQDPDEDDDNISAYLESSPDHSRDPSPEKTPEPFKEFDNSNLDGQCHNFNDFCDEINSVGDEDFEDIPDVPENEKSFKLGRCKVDIERSKLNEDEMRIAREYIDSRQVAKQKVKNQKVIVTSSQKRKNSNRDNKANCNKLREKLRQKRILAKKKLRKSKRCFECDACKKPDCRKCLMCKDMKKYGGKGLKKQSCMTRPTCLLLENNKGAFKTISAKRIKEIRKKGSLNKENLSQIKSAKKMKKASRVEELKSSRKPLSRTSSLEILEVESTSSVKDKGPETGASKERKGLNELKKRNGTFEELKSSRKALSRTSALEVLEVESPSSVKDKGPKAGASKERKGPNDLKKRKASAIASLIGPTLSNRREKLQKFAMVNSDDVMIRKNKIEDIRKKFKEQEEKALATNGKISSMMDLSREELLFGFYL